MSTITHEPAIIGWKCQLVGATCLLAIPAVQAFTYYVSPTGQDSNPGTINKPFAGLQKGADVAVAGDTGFIRGGTYAFNGPGAASDAGVYITTSGTSNSKRICFWAYPGEKPVLDFSQVQFAIPVHQSAGIKVTNGNWLHFKGLEICNVPEPSGASNNGFWGDPMNNIIVEQCNSHNNAGPGFFIQNGTGGNLILNCDSHDNFDSLATQGEGQNADGFGVHYQSTGTSTIIRGCRAWFNSDDGYDCIHQGVPVIYENCWAIRHGYYNHGTISAPKGNGNGFKVGGWGLPMDTTKYQASPIVHHVVKNCVALLNKAAGFYQNHQPTSDTFYNNSSYNNGRDFDMLGYDLTASPVNAGVGMGYYRNNIAYAGTLTSNTTGTLFNAAFNSWDIPGLTISASDFESLDPAGIMGPRNADGTVRNGGSRPDPRAPWSW